jgi:hypothetical protein
MTRNPAISESAQAAAHSGYRDRTGTEVRLRGTCWHRNDLQGNRV